MRLLEELLVPALFALFGGIYLATTTGLPVESTVFPRTLFAVMLVLAALVLIKEAAGGGTTRRERSGGLEALRLPALVFLASTAYAVLFAVAGFPVASVAYLAVLMSLLRVPPVKAAIIAACFTTAMYLVFGKLFLVDL